MTEQRSAEWFDQRKGRVTASNAGAILGFSPYKTADDVMREMVRDHFGAEREFTGNIATEYGVAHESIAITDYELSTGATVIRCGFYPFEEWLGASPDGFIWVNGLIEVKCPYSKNIYRKASEQLHYYAQMQIEMYCSNREYADFYQWAPGAATIERVDINEKWLDENLPKLRAFYDNYLEELKSPEKHLEPKRKEIDTTEIAQLLSQYDDLQDAIDNATARKKEVLAMIVTLAGEQDAIICGRNLTKVEKQGAISYATAIKDIAPDADLEKYRGKPSSYWIIK